MAPFIYYLLPITFLLVLSRRHGSSPSSSSGSGKTNNHGHEITMQFDHVNHEDEVSCYFYEISSQCFDHLVVYPSGNNTYSVLSTLLVETPQIGLVSDNESHAASVGIKILKRYENEFEDYNQRTKDKHEKKPKKCSDHGPHTWPYVVYFCLRDYTEINMTDNGRYCVVSDEMTEHCGDDLVVPDLSFTIAIDTPSPTFVPTTTSPTSSPTAGNGTGEIMINRPENGIGTILISYPDYPENADVLYDENIVEFVITKQCLDDGSLSMTDVISTILSTYSGCIELFDSDEPYYDSNYFVSISLYMNLLCDLSTIQQTDAYLNYDELCMEFILHPEFIELFDVECKTDTFTESLKYWGLDLLDTKIRTTTDYTPSYTYPVTTLGESDVELYIIDSGIQANHVEFATNQVIHEMRVAANSKLGPCFKEVSGGGGKYIQWCTHGTHVAGTAGGKTIGASRNFRIHDYAVFFYGSCPKCRGITTRPLDIEIALVKIIADLKKRRNENKDSRGVINMSLGGLRNEQEEKTYKALFEEINDNGGIVVVAAGNEDIDVKYTMPANSDLAITVGAFQAADFCIKWERIKTSFSNYGSKDSKVDIFGPGYQIYSAVASAETDKYGYKSGTSMASPMIAGMVANLLHADNTLTLKEVKETLLENKVKVTGDECDTLNCYAPVYECPEEEDKSEKPTEDPTLDPTMDPTNDPTTNPTTITPTRPTDHPTRGPTVDPTTGSPTSLIYIPPDLGNAQISPIQQLDEFVSKERNNSHNDVHNLYGFGGFVFAVLVNVACLVGYMYRKDSKSKQSYVGSEV
eukprot:1075005_1